MSSRKQTLTPPSPQTGREGSAGSGAAGVEIAGFPQILYTRTFGDPDTLFVPLLDASREALSMLERLSSHGENRPNAVMLSGMHLVSSLLRDSSFSLVARGLSHENVYRVDLDAGTLHVHTRLYAVVSRRTSFFKVEIASKIAAGPFVVRNPTQGTAIMQLEETRLRQPNFFSSTLAQECLRAQMEQERFGQVDDPANTDANSEVRMVLTFGLNKVPVTLRQKEAGGSWDILDGRRQEWVGMLSSDMEKNMLSLTNFLQQLFANK